MNFNDRIALLLGRSIIRAEEMTVRAEQAEARVAELETEKAEWNGSSKAAPVKVS